MLKRRLLQSTFVIGIVFTAAVGTLWVRAIWSGNDWPTDTFSIVRSWRDREAAVAETLALVSSRKRICVTWERERGRFDEDPPRIHPRVSATPGWRVGQFGGGGFRFARTVVTETAPDLQVMFVSPPREWMDFGYTIEEPWARDWVIDRAVFVPTWFVFALCVAPTVISGRRVWRNRRSSLRAGRGLCVHCGYDLRGAAHERCPECGETVALAPGGAV